MSPSEADDEFRAFWEDFNTILDAVLDRFEAHYLESHRILDVLLAKATPGKGDVKVLRNNVPNNEVSFRYFFEKLRNPAWLRLLRDGGLFDDPPGPDHESQPGMVAYPPWPQAHYLLRMASVEPELVCEIALGVHDQGNVSVRDDLVEIALELPPGLAQRFVPKVKDWAATPHLLITDRLLRLIVHLAGGGHLGPVLEIASGVFALKAEQQPPLSVGDHTYQPPPKLTAYMDLREYEEGLKRVISQLADADREKALAWVCDLLQSALDLEGKEHSDWSNSWRRAIEDSNQNVDLDVKGPLLAAVGMQSSFWLSAIMASSTVCLRCWSRAVARSFGDWDCTCLAWSLKHRWRSLPSDSLVGQISTTATSITSMSPSSNPVLHAYRKTKRQRS